MAHVPYYFPFESLVVSLDRLFDVGEDTRRGGPCQQALREILSGLPDLGVAPLKGLASVFVFSSHEVYDTVVDLLAETDCLMRPDVPEPGAGLREVISEPVTAEGTGSSDDGTQATVTLRLDPMPGGSLATFEDETSFGASPVDLMDILYQRVGMLLANGDQGYPVIGVRVVLTGVRVEKAGGGSAPASGTPNPFFRAFDWVFDTIDKMFAGGSGSDFASMESGSNPTGRREATWNALTDALRQALRGNTTLVSPVVQTELRFPIDVRETVSAAYTENGGVVTDETHDGTTWTLIGEAPATTLVDINEILRDNSGTIQTKDIVRLDSIPKS